MKVIFIFDLSETLIELEHDVIAQLINLPTLTTTKHTVNFLKAAWLIDRLEEMRLVAFYSTQYRIIDPNLIEQIKRLSRNLDTRLYHSVRIPHEISAHHRADLEIRGNDVYIRFG